MYLREPLFQAILIWPDVPFEVKNFLEDIEDVGCFPAWQGSDVLYTARFLFIHVHILLLILKL